MSDIHDDVFYFFRKRKINKQKFKNICRSIFELPNGINAFDATFGVFRKPELFNDEMVNDINAGINIKVLLYNYKYNF